MYVNRALWVNNTEPSRDTHTRATAKGELIHVDLAGGGLITQTIGGSKYLITAKDDATCLLRGGTLRRKSEIVGWMEALILLMKTEGNPVQRCRADNEFSRGAMLALFTKHGIQFEPTSPYNPEQNGVAERGYRTIFSKVRAILFDSGLPQTLWGEAANTVIYLLNRCPTRSLDNKTPYEAWNGKTPNLDHLRIFGCIAYHYDNDPQKGKLDSRTIKCRLLGYEGKGQFRL